MSNIEPQKAEVKNGLSDRLRLSIFFEVFPNGTEDAKPQAEQHGPFIPISSLRHSEFDIRHSAVRCVGFTDKDLT